MYLISPLCRRSCTIHSKESECWSCSVFLVAAFDDIPSRVELIADRAKDTSGASLIEELP